MTSPPNFNPTVGRFAADRYQFRDHVDGYDFRHLADQVDLNTPININGTDYDDVYDAILAISSLVGSPTSTISGFITIGDGYDTYHNAISTPNTPYDSAIPTLDAAINDVLYNTNNPSYARIRDGGVIVVKSGTYKIGSTIFIPPGTTIMGEGFGTKLINALPVQAPMFKIKSDGYKGFGSTTDNLVDNTPDINYKFAVTRETKLFNFIIADNFVEPKFLGDTSYLSPQNTSAVALNANRGLMSVEQGANLIVDGVKFLGRVSYSTPGSVITNNGITTYGINTDTISSTAGTSVNIRNSFFDAFSIPVRFTANGASNDYFKFVNNNIRTYGFLNNNLTDGYDNSGIILNSCNATITDNYVYGTLSNISSFVYFQTAAAAASLQSTPKIEICGNNISVNKSSNTSNTTFSVTKYDASITNIDNALSVMVYGNNFQNQAFYVAPNTDTTIDNPALYASRSLVLLSPPAAGGSVYINPLGAGGTVNINPASVVNILPVASNSAVNINPAGSAAIININPTGNNAAVNISPVGSSVNVNIHPSDAGSTLNMGAGEVLLASQTSLTIGSGSYTFIQADTGNGQIGLSGTVVGFVGDPLRFGYNSIDLTGQASPYVLSLSEYNTQTVKIIGTLTSDIIVEFPAIAGYAKLVENATTANGGYRVFVRATSGSLTILPNSARYWMYCDGTNLLVANRSRYMPVDTSITALSYKFSENSSATTFASNGSNAETFTSGLVVTGSSPGMPGILDNCIYFAGGTTEEFVSSGNTSAVDLTGTFRMSLWVKPLSTVVSDGNLCGKLYGSASGSFVSPFYTARMYVLSGILHGSVATAGFGTINLTALRAMNLYDWNHIGLTYDLATGAASLWLNGKREKVVTGTGGSAVLNNSGPYWIGAAPAPSNSANTPIFYADDFRIEMGGSITTSSFNWFADVYRMGIGQFDDIGIPVN